MKKHHEFGQFLLANNYIEAKELAGGLEVALESGEPIGEILERMGVLPKARLAEAVRRYLGIPEISLTQVIIDTGIAGLIPEEMARRYTLIPFEQRGLSNAYTPLTPHPQGLTLITFKGNNGFKVLHKILFRNIIDTFPIHHPRPISC